MNDTLRNKNKSVDKEDLLILFFSFLKKKLWKLVARDAHKFTPNVYTTEFYAVHKQTRTLSHIVLLICYMLSFNIRDSTYRIQPYSLSDLYMLEF